MAPLRPLLCLVYAPLLISALRRVLQPADGPGPPLESIILDKLASNNAPLHLFMWGDSTMQRQQHVLAALVQSNATLRTATEILLPVAFPASLDLGTTRPVTSCANRLMCKLSRRDWEVPTSRSPLLSV